MDVQKLNSLGWKAKIGLQEGIERVYKEFSQLYAAGV
jgi:GDP-L-fucose synthase